MAQTFPPLQILSLRGGLNDSDPMTALEADACQVADNVEFVLSTVGERRLGCQAIDLPASITSNTTLNAVTWMFSHIPTNSFGDTELWVFAQELLQSNSLLTRRSKSTWTTITPFDDIVSTNWMGHAQHGLSFHLKGFHAYQSAVNRMHVWDGTQHRRVGLAQPAAAPTGANTGGGGTYTGVRYARIRYITKSGSQVLYRSEPSDTLTWTPSGTADNFVLTRPALINEHETHWEIELSTDNANFYKMADQATGAPTYTDSTVYATGYTGGTLSDPIGVYALIGAVQYLVPDDDRLIFGGHYTDSALASTVGWTPPTADPGVGNDERVDASTNSTLNLDGGAGGGLTGMAKGPGGYIYCFKLDRIEQLVRQNNRARAYKAYSITQHRGALPGSVIEAVDEQGRVALYFLDPAVGPCRIGPNGLEWCGQDIFRTWKTVNIDAPVPCHGQFHADKLQIHWWVATNGGSYPNTKIVVHTNLMKMGRSGIRGGWTRVPLGDRIADAHCSVGFAPNVDTTDNRSIHQVPFIGKALFTVAGTSYRQFVLRCDTGSTDARVGAQDVLSVYRARLRTRPFLLNGLMGDSGVLLGTVLTNAATSAFFTVRLIGDFAKIDALDRQVDCAPSGQETFEIKDVDDLNLSELTSLEIEIGDLDPTLVSAVQWQIYQLDLKVVPGARP